MEPFNTATMRYVFYLRVIYFFILCEILSLGYGANIGILPKPTGTSSSNLPQWNSKGDGHPDSETSNLPLFTLNYPRIQIPLEITLWVLLASFAKIGEQTFTRSKLVSVTYSKP